MALAFILDNMPSSKTTEMDIITQSGTDSKTMEDRETTQAFVPSKADCTDEHTFRQRKKGTALRHHPMESVSTLHSATPQDLHLMPTYSVRADTILVCHTLLHKGHANCVPLFSALQKGKLWSLKSVTDLHLMFTFLVTTVLP